jgi:RND family efflux transporter MFP subunit
MKRYGYLSGLLLMAVVACSGEKKGDAEDETVETVLPERINEVTVMKLALTDFQHELISNGTLSARRHVGLRFESAEPLAAIHVKNGDRVREGQPLAELATFRLANRTAQAKDALERAGLDLQDVLIGQGFTLEDSARIPPATMQLVRTRSGYNQALAQYELALYEERHAVLRAPFDGVVANLFARPFNMASTTDVFCTIVDPRSLEASFTVLESELPLISEGDRVIVTPFALSGETTEGRISEINPFVDENGMVKVKASVVNAGKLFEGMKMRVSILRSLPNRFVVPKEAVVLRSGRQVIFTLDGNKALWVYVQTGLENASSYTVVDGLKEGDTVITGGNVNLAHESPVTVIQ